ncbi:hypothetical protein SASPL_130362 [Salvia splendens]|uniref:K Homology domain-containing protein n=2 Tax=Salvia splendens TaxID=180675 RepID=A0A8X8X800_SALSN|nr:hypothetical protein SASPL_130362 [Salvia splendens]
MKGASFDLSKEPNRGKRLKSSSVEIKWGPLTWCSRYRVTLLLVSFAGLALPSCRFLFLHRRHRLNQPAVFNCHFAGSDTAIIAAAAQTMSSARYMAYSPSPSAPHSPHIAATRTAASALVEQEKYLTDLLAERNKLNPFMAVLPNCYRMLNQEILRVTTLLGSASVLEQSMLEHASPLASGGIYSNGGANANRWASSPFQSEISSVMQSSSTPNWLGSQGSSSGLIVKRTIRVDIPVDQYPSYNFVGRLLGPRGNSLKRVEATTECRVLIRGRGSIKDPTREEMMRGKPGYEHLNEPLHILVEAELPVEIIDARLMQSREILEDLLKPMDEAQDYYKKQQLRELALLNGTLRDDVSQMSGSVSPFHNSLGMKRAKTRV